MSANPSISRSLDWRTVRRWVGWAALAAALAFFLPYLVKNASALAEFDWNARSLNGFALAVVLWLGDMAIGALGWHMLLRLALQPARLRDAAALYFTAQFGKYLPGNVAQHVGRVALAKAQGYEIPRVLFSMVVEIALVILATVLFALACLWLARSPVGGLERLGNPGVLATLTVACLLVIVAASLWWARRYRKALAPVWSHLKILGTIIVMNAFGAFLLGLSAMALAVGVFRVESRDVFLFGAVMTLSWLAGFVAPGAPAGLGVREAMMVAMLDPVIGTGAALGTTLAMRVVSITSDGLALAFAGVLRSLARRRGG
jgi:glycosyltransferase 2 family protein